MKNKNLKRKPSAEDVKKAKRRRILLTSVAAVLLLCFIGGVCVLGIDSHVVKSADGKLFVSAAESGLYSGGEPYDCIIVLGAGVKDNGYPSDMLTDRLLTGVALYDAGLAPKIIMSGDHGREDYDEVNVMKSFAIDSGVPSEDIFMDHAGFSTYESLYRAKEIFGCDRVIIVTQKYHLYRALYIAEELGIEAVGVGADIRMYAGQTYRDAREILARVKDFFTVMFKVEPTYRGDKIDITGSGDVTNDLD